jgi:hypothetical protein
MSYYFRPPNSREQNLFIIRASIDNLTYVNFTNNTLNNTAYTSPSNVFLPAGFSLTYNQSLNTFIVLTCVVIFLSLIQGYFFMQGLENVCTDKSLAEERSQSNFIELLNWSLFLSI